MKNLTLENIANACNGKLYYADNASKTQEASCVVIDSRLVEDAGVFVAVKGEKVDGHTFIKQVFEKGAMAVICEELPEEAYGPCILVEKSLDALREIAKFYRSCIDTKIVGITGSVGKTSTKEFIAGVLGEKFKVNKTAGNLNNTIGVPLTILKIKEDVDIAVVEMGINQFGEMSLLTSIARPDICVITNIGECHLEFLIDRDGVLRAKTEIFEGLSQDGTVILNGDDDKLLTVKDVNGKAPIFFGINNENVAYLARNIKERGLCGSDCTIAYRENSFNARIPLPGRHMVLNGLAATAVAKCFDMTDEEIISGLSKLQSVGGRNNVLSLKDITVVDDCYNANPTSTKAAIDLLCTVESKKVAILGDMFELGKEEKELHFDLGSYAATKLIDKIICVGELSKNTYDGAMKAKAACVYYYASVDEALGQINDIIDIGDTVLVKASNGMHFNRIVEFLKNEKN